MGGYLLLALALAGLGLLAYRGGRIWADAGRRGFEWPRRLGWALLGALSPARYWWGARLAALAPQERADLLARETAALGLSRADSLRCPLCRAEVPHAWTLTPDGRPAVAPGPIRCPRCDFRLDSCRHCARFLPGNPHVWGQLAPAETDFTFGRCGHYKEARPVEQVCPSDMARRLKARGWDTLRSPIPIVDSFLPPDFCSAFAPDRKRLRLGGVRWPDARRTALLRLLSPPSPPDTVPLKEAHPSGDEEWLL